MAPVRIRLYGLFPRTKRQYVVQQVFAVVLMIPLLAIWFYWHTQVELDLAGKPLPRYLANLVWIFDLIPWAVAILLTAVALETVVVLKTFDRKEAAQQASEAAAERKEEAAVDAASKPGGEHSSE